MILSRLIHMLQSANFQVVDVSVVNKNANYQKHPMINFEEISIHDIPERSPGFLLWHICTSWRSSIEGILKPMDLTHLQFVVLATLGWLTRNGDRVSQAAIGKMAGLDPNTTSQIIKGLEHKDLIK